jgi:nitrogen fixation-related uncharacterized protein
MTRVSRHYFIRALISIVWGGLWALLGAPWWAAVIMGGIAFAWFLWAPHSGRYVVLSRPGEFSLKRDERGQTIVNKASRNAFAATMLIIAGIGLYFGVVVQSDVPVFLINMTVMIGLLTYFISDFWLRKRA